jgi:hypothetical protein
MINYVEKKRSSLVQQYLRLELEKEPNVSSLEGSPSFYALSHDE